MTDIYIDNQRVDTDSQLNISISLGITSMQDIGTSRIPYSKTISIPMTLKNMEIMGDAEQINSSYMFNQQEHTAKITAEGCTVLEGIPYLIETEAGLDGCGQEGHYLISIIGAGKEWVKRASQCTFRNLNMEFSEKITPAMVKDSWTWEKPVRFLPVQRERFPIKNESQNIFPPVKILTFEDYHPFIHIKSVITRIFKNAGYNIKSEFMDSDMFGKLYMSGNYPKKNIQGLKEKMDFLAGRFNDISQTADSLGRVYANPHRTFNTIGNIVDTADPKETHNGTTIEGVFTNGGCFGKDEKRVVFIPAGELIAAFEYSITYTTDYYMLSREELKGFNTINLDDGQLRKYKIANRNTDRRSEFRANRNYMAIIFGHLDGDSYQFRYDQITNDNVDTEHLQPGDFNTITSDTFNSRTKNITVLSSERIINPQIWIKRSSESNYTLYGEDWALYDGYVKERGEVTVEMTVRSSAERLLPSNPKYFDLIFFGGAEQGMNFKLHKSTTIKPVFAQYPSEGSTIGFYDIAAHDATCLDIINSVKQMFNLLFYTDNITKQVIIEPKDHFYTNDIIIDWSGKIDFSKPVTIYEPGGNISKQIAFEYQTGDGAVTKWNHTNQQTFGKWIADIDNNYAKEQERSYKNLLFTASLNQSGDYPDAKNVSLVQAGDRDKASSEGTEELNFLPKIVIYDSLKKLPAGQQWGWPANQDSYPSIYFHNSENNATLCFEDRDGITGLNKYWKKTIALYNKSKNIELYINLEPKDIEPFLVPNRNKHDFRALFRLTIDGENTLYRLEEIKGYNPTGGTSTKCLFIKEIYKTDRHGKL